VGYKAQKGKKHSITPESGAFNHGVRREPHRNKQTALPSAHFA
jgi:hypothetical protein